MQRGDQAGRRRGFGRRWRSRFAQFVLALLVGAGGAVSLSSATGAQHAARMARSVWKSCGPRLQCARVRVPLSWARPAQGTITLAVIRYRATRPARRIGSLFVNFGGPGVAGVPMIRAGGAFLDTLGQGRFDVIGWDPRGTGTSTHVRCFADTASQTRFWGRGWSIPTTEEAARRYVPRTVAFARRCSARSGRLLTHISTADTARDLDYLRHLVGDRKLSYIGYSYGSVLGQTYANMFPDRVRAMVLDGIVNPITFTTSVEAQNANGVADTDRVFSKFQALCQQAGRERCALASGGSVSRRVNALLTRLRRGPIPAPSAPPLRRLTYGDLLIELFSRLGGPDKWPELADGLERAARGDGTMIERAVQAGRSGYESALVSAVALQCADKPLPRHGPRAWPRVIGHLTQISPIGGPVQGWWLWAPCASWRAASASRYTGPWNAKTPNPILVIGNRFDPQTPVVNAHRVARLLGHAVLLTENGYGHTSGADPSACTDHATSVYLVRLRTPRKGTVCQSDRTPFDPQFGQPLP